MSYQVLARKWRPHTFEQVVGQQHVLQPLVSALNTQRLHHAYLFTGTRGVGKTTIARILAKSLNCETGITATPCGQCSACQEIDAGRFVDLLEIDAASRTKVEDTRELLDNVQYRPTRGRYKVYLIDEVHMLSRHSFNALLKTLEEPPEHVKFLLATTDPQKLPITVLSRCLQFNLKALTQVEIGEHLQFVLAQEQIPYVEVAIAALARAAKGSLRDALSLTDQAIAQGDQQVSEAAVQAMLGSVPQTDLQQLLRAVVNGNSIEVFQQLDAIAAITPDVSGLLDELQRFLHQLALYQVVPAANTVFDLSDDSRQLATQLPDTLLQVYYRIVLEGRRELAHALDVRSGVEMTLLRLLAFRPYQDNDSGELSTPPAAQGRESNSTTPPASGLTTLASDGSSITESTDTAATGQADTASDVTTQTVATPQTQSSPAEPEAFDANVGDDPDDEGASDELAEQMYAIEQEAQQLSAQPAVAGQESAVNDSFSNANSNAEHDLAQLLATRTQLRQKKNADKEKSLSASNAVTSVNPRQQPTSVTDTAAAVASTQLDSMRLAADTSPATAQGVADDTNITEAEAIAQQAQAMTEAADPALLAQLPEQIDTDVRSAAQLDRWSAVLDNLEIAGLTRQILIHSQLQQSGELYQLLIAPDQARLMGPQNETQIRQQLQQLIGDSELNIITQQPAQPTPYLIQQRINQLRLERAKQQLADDPALQALQQRFGAQLLTESINAL